MTTATKALPENVSLHYQDDRSDKVYHVQVEKVKGGHVVNFQFGRRGSTLQTGTKTSKPVSLDEALKIRERLLRQKLGKGYQVMNGAAHAAPVQPEPDWTDYPIELLQEIPKGRVPSLLQDERYWLQEKCDGERRQIAKHGNKLTGYNRRGTAVPLPTALSTELRQVRLESFVLDGEIEGDQFIAFDLLDGGSTTPESPYSVRFAHLLHLLKGMKMAKAVSTWTDTAGKKAAAIALRDLRAEGMVFKLASAPYAGSRNGQHYKYKFVKTCTAKVLRVGDKGKQSAAVGLLEKGKWLDVGTVSTIGKPKTHVGDLIEVRYLYATKARRLYQAIYMRKRDDLDDSACAIAQLIFKQGVER